MLRYLKLYKTYLKMAIKAKLSYKMDAIVSIFSFLFTNGINFLSLMLMLRGVPSLGDWTFERIVFVYGLGLIPKGIDHIFTDRLWIIGMTDVVKGNLDIYMTKPVGVLFQACGERFMPEGFGELILGTLFIVLYAPMTGVAFTAAVVIPLVLCCLLATATFTAIKLFTATLAFWMKRSISLMNFVYSFSEYTMYPLKYIGKTIMVILYFIVPFGLAIYYPAQTLYDGGSMWLACLVVAATSSVLMTLAYLFWRKGLSRYESVGS